MKKLLVALSLLTFSSCSNKNEKDSVINGEIVDFSETANGKVDKDKLPVIKFAEGTYDFGKIIQGEKVSHKFSFTNEGKSSLIITSAKASCGCTIAEPTKDPIPPGGTGTIDVVFDSNGKSGMITKSISVLTNCEPNTVFITITGNVIVPDDAVEKK
ncbi:MAG: DUF1573 domain-containing protein [Bacteroidia bacterium]